MNTRLLPGSSLGVIGGGQLGRYFVLAARRSGYDTWVLDPDADGPAMQVSAGRIVADYDDRDALEKLANRCQAITIEFENVPAESLEILARHCIVAPSADTVRTAQDRLKEKRVALSHGLVTVPHAAIMSLADVDSAVAAVSLPAILKSTRLGYDGKSQVSCANSEAVRRAFCALQCQPCVLEQRIDLAAELSVVLARGQSGDCVSFPPADNIHIDGILATSAVPSLLSSDVQKAAAEASRQLAKGMDYVGVLAVEYFVDREGALLFNEMAPRPHNSGHYTLDATSCSQFDLQVRALCGLPLHAPRLLSPVSMLNLLGDRWLPAAPRWEFLMNIPDAVLHMYGKREARPGRKMAHVNCLATSTEEARSRVEKLSRELGPPP